MIILDCIGSCGDRDVRDPHQELWCLPQLLPAPPEDLLPEAGAPPAPPAPEVTEGPAEAGDPGAGGLARVQGPARPQQPQLGPPLRGGHREEGLLAARSGQLFFWSLVVSSLPP